MKCLKFTREVVQEQRCGLKCPRNFEAVGTCETLGRRRFEKKILINNRDEKDRCRSLD